MQSVPSHRHIRRLPPFLPSRIHHIAITWRHIGVLSQLLTAMPREGVSRVGTCSPLSVEQTVNICNERSVSSCCAPVVAPAPRSEFLQRCPRPL